MKRLAVIAITLCLGVAPSALGQTSWPNQREADFVLRNFRFGSGETLAELRIHYITLGTARKNAAGEIVNGVLLLHGTSGSSTSWLQPTLANELFAGGQPLDASRYFVIIPDGIGAGGSSKPSDGLRGGFPHYRYRDMVEAHYRLVTEGLGVRHLRLVLGTSMGGMQTWMWGEMYPDFMDGLVPIASQPSAMSGRNWLTRRVRIEAIRNDPDWNNGDYTENPRHYIYSAAGHFTTESPTRVQEMAPTLKAANELYERRLAEAAKGDANNQLWAIEAIQDYNPEPDLDKIKAKVLLINDAEDHANPPDLGTVEQAMQRVKHGRYVLIPAGPDTHGHFSHYYAKLWKPSLIEFMATLGPEQPGAAAAAQ